MSALEKLICPELIELVRVHVQDCRECKIKNIAKELPVLGMIVSQKEIDAFIQGKIAHGTENKHPSILSVDQFLKQSKNED